MIVFYINLAVSGFERYLTETGSGTEMRFLKSYSVVLVRNKSALKCDNIARLFEGRW